MSSRRGHRALPSSSPSSRVLEADSAAADPRAPDTGEGPRNRAPTNQAQSQHQPQFPSLTTPTIPQRQDGLCSSITPSRARADTRSPSPDSPSSSASSSRPSDVSWDSSVSSGRTYASVVRGPANENTYAKLSSRLLNFVKHKCTIYSETAAYGKRTAISMREAPSFNLRIAYEHILEYDKELAYAIFNCQDSFDGWVYPTLSQFLIGEGIVKNVVLRMNYTFYTMPPSSKPLSDFIQEHGPLISMKSICGGSFELCVAHDVGMMLVYGFLVVIFNNHAKGLTWNGGFSISDMMVVNCTNCRISKMPMLGGSRCRAEDLHKFGEIFMPMFKDNGKMALYFDVLEKDLRTATEEEVEEAWYREYLRSHVSLKPSISRYYLECGLQHAAKSFGAKGTLIRSVLGEYSLWKTLIPTKLTKNTLVTDSLYQVFWYKGEHVEDPFPDTVGGLLAYKRNYLQHGHEYVKVQDHTELEQFAAKTFPQALPNILRRLLRDCQMHINGPFTVHWKAYCTSRVGDDGNTEGRTGICITFSEMDRVSN